jgi:hypothetical protein
MGLDSRRLKYVTTNLRNKYMLACIEPTSLERRFGHLRSADLALSGERRLRRGSEQDVPEARGAM